MLYFYFFGIALGLGEGKYARLGIININGHTPVQIY